jgi:hypothetical protein
MNWRFYRRRCLILIFLGLLIPTLADMAEAQSFPFVSLGSFGAVRGHSSLAPSLGNFSAGYIYNSYAVQDGVSFSEVRLRYALPLNTGDGDLVTAFAFAHLTDLSNERSLAFGLASNALRFGGSWLTRVGTGQWVGARGEYDATQRGQDWYSGGQIAGELIWFVSSNNLASLRVTYYSHSAGGDQPVFPKNPSGFELSTWYGHDIIPGRARLMLIVSGYELDIGGLYRQRGGALEASLSVLGGLLFLKGRLGHDSILLNNYSAGMGLALAF